MSDDELSLTASTRSGQQQRRPSDHDLQELDRTISDADLDRLLELRAKRIGGGAVARRGKILRHTGSFLVLAQIRFTPPGSTNPVTAKAGEIVELTAEDVALFTKPGREPAIEPQLV